MILPYKPNRECAKCGSIYEVSYNGTPNIIWRYIKSRRYRLTVLNNLFQRDECIQVYCRECKATYKMECKDNTILEIFK